MVEEEHNGNAEHPAARKARKSKIVGIFISLKCQTNQIIYANYTLASVYVVSVFAGKSAHINRKTLNKKHFNL